MNDPRVGIIHLGRDRGLGEQRRVASLSNVFRAAGADVFEVPVLSVAPAGPRDVLRADLRALTTGAAVPETLAWSPRAVAARLARERPRLVVCVTARAFHPALTRCAPVVLDLVDRLSTSYRDRAAMVGPGRGLLFRVLARPAARFERRARTGGLRRIAAGWRDAGALAADWVPNTLTLPPPVTPAPAHDLIFFGNLSYPPNIEAVQRLDALWPELQARRPGITLLLAGARPGAEVTDRVRRRGWSLRADFDDLAGVLGSARLGVCPLLHGSGMQNKVLEAAAHGVAQVVSPVAADGFDPAFPLIVAADDERMVDHLLTLLDDGQLRARVAGAARNHVAARYTVGAWTPWAAAALDAAGT